MFKIMFNLMINMIATVIQIIVWPINEIISNTLPDISSKVLEVTGVFSTIFSSMSWALGLIPQPLLTTIIFIIGVEIAKHTIFRSTHLLINVWNVFQKIKFW